MKYLLFVLLICSFSALSSQASLENPISPAFQNTPENVPAFIKLDWLFNTTDLPECKPFEAREASGPTGKQVSPSVGQEVHAYPNPNPVCMLTVDFEVRTPGSQLLLSGMDGKLLYSENLGDFTGRYQKQLDLSVASSTVVILTVVQDGVPVSKKIVVE
ncbi:MAG: T9SS type A sorting domain-containing protein [Saprospiraceae bacterium]|nr:T9SS type A sorting domain-containing protein [Saprospiraceae bacterium]